jgi:predicted nucleic acid-binding protein
VREAAAKWAMNLTDDERITVAPQSTDQFRRALEFYRQRLDKEWSLVDCASILVMLSEGITEALTHDHHFEQAGFKPLLRNPS